MNPTATSSSDGAPPSVFISYRREDTSAHAGRLYDAMVARFGERHVFMDVDIAPGVNFVERITEAVSGCLVLIVVMGPRWANVEDEDGAARLANPDDFVRLEVETALRRDEVTPIPVLVSGAQMPKRDQLPAELHPITQRNALELSDTRWSYDVDRLNTTLDVLLADTLETRLATPVVEPPTPAPAPPPRPAEPLPGPIEPPPAPAPPSRPPGNLVLEGAMVAAVTAFAARLLAQLIPDGWSDPTNLANVVLRRAGTWALVAAVVLVWLAVRAGMRDSGRLAVRGLLVGAAAGALGGLIWGLPVFAPDPDLAFAGNRANWIQVGSLAVTGGLLGSVVSELWRRPLTGLVCGAAAGALVQLGTIALGWSPAGVVELALYFAIAAAAIVGLTLAVVSRPRS